VTIVPGEQPREIVGVVGDIHDEGVNRKAPATVYWPARTSGVPESVPRAAESVPRAVTIAIRSSRAGTESFLRQIREAIWSVNPNLALTQVRTLGEVYDASMARTSFTLVMLAIAGSMALALGVIGIYGVISYAVSQQRREIGIRLALGAQLSAMTRMFVRHALLVTAVGVLIGLTASVGLMRLMGSLLFGVSPLDPLTYVAVPAVLTAAAAVASYLPARRAAAVDPMETLRGE
jgi:ABC-type antimicrobial peptide transport system permease subunit